MLHGRFCELDGWALCEDHFCIRSGLICAGCRAIISNCGYLTIGNKKFHEDHVKCSKCGRPLDARHARLVDDNVVCAPCAR